MDLNLFMISKKNFDGKEIALENNDRKKESFQTILLFSILNHLNIQKLFLLSTLIESEGKKLRRIFN
jgi:hypothetical protein